MRFSPFVTSTRDSFAAVRSRAVLLVFVFVFVVSVFCVPTVEAAAEGTLPPQMQIPNVGPYTITEIPNINLTDSTRFVSDPDDMLSSRSKARIDSVLCRLNAETTAEVAFVVVRDIVDPEDGDFATGLFKEWGIGKSDVDNGILVLFVLDRHKVTIRTGSGIEKVLTTGECDAILQTMFDYLKIARFGDGLYHCASELYNRLSVPMVAGQIRSNL